MTLFAVGFSKRKILQKLQRRGQCRTPQPDAEHFTALVIHLASDVHCYAHSLCGDKDLAEELTQEAFLRAWKSFHHLRDEAAVKSWLFTIVKREHARQFARRRPETVNIDASQLAAEADVAAGAEAVVLNQALRRLPDEYREPLVLQVIGGYSLEEIAARLGLSVGAVTSRVFRARQKLREALEDNQRTAALKEAAEA